MAQCQRHPELLLTDWMDIDCDTGMLFYTVIACSPSRSLWNTGFWDPANGHWTHHVQHRRGQGSPSSWKPFSVCWVFSSYIHPYLAPCELHFQLCVLKFRKVNDYHFQTSFAQIHKLCATGWLTTPPQLRIHTQVFGAHYIVQVAAYVFRLSSVNKRCNMETWPYGDTNPNRINVFTLFFLLF